MTRRIRDYHQGATWMMKELVPDRGELTVLQLSPMEFPTNFDLQFICTFLQPVPPQMRTHRLQIIKLFHDGKKAEEILDLRLNLLLKDFDWENPQRKAERVIFRLAFWVALIFPEFGLLMSQTIEDMDWMQMIKSCATEELGKDHEIMPS